MSLERVLVIYNKGDKAVVFSYGTDGGIQYYYVGGRKKLFFSYHNEKTKLEELGDFLKGVVVTNPDEIDAYLCMGELIS